MRGFPARNSRPLGQALGGAVFVATLIGLAGLPLASAQTSGGAVASETAESPYEGSVIREILIRAPAGQDDGGNLLYTPIEGVGAQRALNQIRSYRGAPYRADTVRSDISRLNRLNLFKSVESLVQPLTDGSVRLVFVLVEQPIIQDVQAAGNRRLNDQQIAAVVDVLVGTPVDRFQIDRAVRRIEDLYREKGYYLAQVTVDETELEESGIVLFRIREGQRVKITDIRFDGAVSFKQRELRREVDTKVGGVFRKGAIDDLQLDADVASLIEFYRNRGHLDVRADRIISPSPDGKEAVLSFLIEEGPQYTLRDLRVDFVGEGEPGFDPVFSREQIFGLMPIRVGDVYGVRAIEDSEQTISDAYGQLGYADAIVRRAELRDPGTPVVDMVLRIAPGPRYTTGEITPAGNSLTKSKVILREVDLLPERPLDTTRIQATERLLQQKRLFNPRRLKLTIQQPDAYEPEYRDLLIEVEETNTGSFDIGGAVNSDAGLIGRIALTQRNFDVADTPESVGELFSGKAFRGAGQFFSIEALPGDRIETYSVSLSEPALFETDYSGAIQLFYRDRDFDEFDERRFGGRLQFGRRFGTRWNGRLNLRLESVELSDIQPFRPTDIFAVAERATLIGIGPSLSRSSLDRIFLPNRGSVTEVAAEQVTGDFSFTKINAEHSVYIPVRRDILGRNTVLSLTTRASYIPQDNDEVPTYERLYLGGQSFRGFDFREVSPKGIRNDTLGPSPDPVGGTWLFFAGAEIRQPILEESLSVVGFVDTGTVTDQPGFDEYRISVGVGIRVSVPQLSPAPLAFDFGFPVVKEDTDERRVFTFSIDLPF